MPIDPEDFSSNPSAAPSFEDVVTAGVSRRSILSGGIAVAAATFLGLPAGARPALAAIGPSGSLLGFKAVATSKDDALVVPKGYIAEVLIPWGTPLLSSGPDWKKDGTNTAAEQALQIGMHHDGMSYFPMRTGPEGSRRGLLVLNHEYTDQVLLFPDGDEVMTTDKVAKSLAAHGVSVVEIAQLDGKWQLVDSGYNRRITGATPVTFSGPVTTDHPALAAINPPTGTLNNCANGHTPWETYLACEENFNGYFGTTSSTWTPTAEQSRYGVTAEGFGYKWHEADPRFDVVINPLELNRFGWVVEIDPYDPTSTPVKRTALGRFKHEGATVWESAGHVILYSGDDQNRDYMYKYISSQPWKTLRAAGQSPLDHGTLYVAKFHADGTGTWLPLVHGQGALTETHGWADQADVLLRTRMAADAVGATPMHRPEWISVNPVNGDVFCCLTNGSGALHPANPRNPNPYGHIIRWAENEGDHRSTTFTWDIFVNAGDPAYDASVTLTEGDIFGSPDGLWVDPDGRMWIQTDISNSSQNLASRGYDRIGNNQMLVADTRTGEIKRFLVGPRGCEITGIATTPDRRTMFINVQHPGEETTAWGAPTPENPRVVSNWPDFDPDGRPRAATVVIRKRDGGIIGT